MKKSYSQNNSGAFDFPEVNKPRFEPQLHKISASTQQKVVIQKLTNSLNNNKIVTQSTELPQTIRSQIQKPLINSERFIFDLDASMVYIHREKIMQFEELEQQRILQLLRDVQQKVPQVNDKVNHFIGLAGQFENEKVNSLVNQFIKVVEQLLQILDEKTKEIKEYQFALKQSREQVSNNSRLIEDQSQMIKYMESQNQNAKNVTRTFQRSNELAVINVQLEKKVELLNQNLQFLMNQNKDSLATQLQQKIDQLNKTIEEQQNKLYDDNNKQIQLSQQIQALKSTEFKHQIQLKKLEDKIQDYEIKLKELTFQASYSKEQKDQYRELYYMTYEDLQMNKLNTQTERKQMQKSFEKIRMLQDRIDEMTVKRSKEVDAPFQSRVEGDMIQLQAITKILDEDHVFQRYMMSSFLKNVQEYDSKLVDAYVDVKRLVVGRDEEAELQTLRYNYPPFTLFLEKRIVDQETQYLQIRPISNNFMGLLRAILDGMYIEFQKNTYISFQSYVISWLSTFTIENHQVIIFPEDTKRVKIEEQLHTFYLDLMVPRLDKVWEVVQFRHFLNDIYSLEELYFYLHARFLLRRGPWMESFDAIYGVVHYMKVQQAESILLRFLEQFDKINQTLVMRAVNERIVEGKKDRKLIQTGFVLQLLLEIFRIDRINRYKILSFAFPAQPITFKQFHKFVRGNFSKCTEGETADLWREVYMISNGIPNLNSFFTAAQSLFIKSLILPAIYTLPLLDSNKKLAFDELNFTTMKIQEQMKELADSDLDVLKTLIPTIYQEEMLRIIKQLIPKNQIQFVNPLEYVFKFMRLILTLKYNTILADGLEEDGVNRKGFITETFTQFITQEISELNKITYKKQSFMSDQEIRISRLQKFAKKKVKKIYVIMSSVLQSRIKQ
ncbi:unnamed protein product [Paramecium octaurelia]|uniref:Uncharacterized protein n=1 Tax=Paramecium octaurelia TaxID=43137 RepID=A0A8S1S4T6_PAROT|nr:unnamed protein product [Paramecium octaurelia]